jgi:hypothetical protein
LVAAAVLALGGLGAAQYWLARTTHRYLNLPLATASLAVIVMIIVGGLVMAAAQGTANQVKDGSYAATLALAKARIAAYSGKSQQSIALIYLGTGGDYTTAEASYQNDYDSARTQLQAAGTITGADPGLGSLAAWNAANTKVYTSATAGTFWAPTSAQAAQNVTVLNSVNATFQRLEDSTNAALATQAKDVDQGLASHYGLLVVTGWLILVIGLIAAGAAWIGVSQRLEEYR